MSAKLAFRISAVILVVFALLHTVGFLSFRAPTTEGQAVFQSMRAVSFQVGNSSFSYGKFYEGFGLNATMWMLFGAFVCWQYANLVQIAPKIVAVMGWAFVAVQLISFVLSVIYFSVAPATFSLVLAAFLAWGAWAASRAASVKS
jgi:hypothetical protein